MLSVLCHVNCLVVPLSGICTVPMIRVKIYPDISFPVISILILPLIMYIVNVSDQIAFDWSNTEIGRKCLVTDCICFV